MASANISELDRTNSQDIKFFTNGNGMTVRERARHFSKFLDLIHRQGTTYGRRILSSTDREVVIRDPFTGENRKMIMFASNNYLGFANHPYIKAKVQEAITKYGVGLGGPPLLNGYTKLMDELEERLADLKHQESAMVFPTGYTSNVGLVTSLVKDGDRVILDSLSHASFRDGLRMAAANSEEFEHNNMSHLESLLVEAEHQYTNVFVGVEGVYSMDGDLAPLDRIVGLCRKYGANILLDDAHGTGVLGETGSGTAEHFGCQNDIDITMGTFSKSFAMTGGFICGPKDIIDLMRFTARPYMFSAALPPVTLAAVLAGIDLMESVPALREKLLYNARYATRKLEPLGLCANPEAAIISIRVPDNVDIRKLNYEIHQRGIFLNSIEYPAVSQNQQRIRVSVTAMHTKDDMNRLADVLFDTFNNQLRIDDRVTS